MAEFLVDVLIYSVTAEARGIHSFDLRPVDGGLLPAFTAGSHIDLHLPNDLVRSYSLVNAPSERHRYVVAVSRDVKSSGGSRYLFETPLEARPSVLAYRATISRLSKARPRRCWWPAESGSRPFIA